MTHRRHALCGSRIGVIEAPRWLRDLIRFLPLKSQFVLSGNVRDLQLAWYFDVDTTRGQEATPLVIDGVLYVTSAWSKVFALDARTGRELWRQPLGRRGTGTPMTFRTARGRQMIALATGSGDDTALVVFARR